MGGCVCGSELMIVNCHVGFANNPRQLFGYFCIHQQQEMERFPAIFAERVKPQLAAIPACESTEVNALKEVILLPGLHSLCFKPESNFCSEWQCTFTSAQRRDPGQKLFPRKMSTSFISLKRLNLEG